MKEGSSMEYFSESYFRDIVGRISSYEQYLYCERVQHAHPNMEFDIFLSYNIADLNVVKGIYFMLRKMGCTVYLDCIVDPDLKRSESDKQTAERIQNRLKHSKSLLYAQSQSANQSNWMPWELGVVDGHTGKCMILPVTKEQAEINPRREYLLLYPYVKPNSQNEMRVFTESRNSYGTTIRNYINGM